MSTAGGEKVAVNLDGTAALMIGSLVVDVLGKEGNDGVKLLLNLLDLLLREVGGRKGWSRCGLLGDSPGSRFLEGWGLELLLGRLFSHKLGVEYLEEEVRLERGHVVVVLYDLVATVVLGVDDEISEKTNGEAGKEVLSDNGHVDIGNFAKGKERKSVRSCVNTGIELVGVIWRIKKSILSEIW
jgi:hypothetical protein